MTAIQIAALPASAFPPRGWSAASATPAPPNAAITTASMAMRRWLWRSRISSRRAPANMHSASVTPSGLPRIPGAGRLFAALTTTTAIRAKPSGRSDCRWRPNRSVARERASSTRTLSPLVGVSSRLADSSLILTAGRP